MRKRQQVINILGINFTLSCLEGQIYKNDCKTGLVWRDKLLAE
jgi:hypothetical protein